MPAYTDVGRKETMPEIVKAVGQVAAGVAEGVASSVIAAPAASIAPVAKAGMSVVTEAAKATKSLAPDAVSKLASPSPREVGRGESGHVKSETLREKSAVSFVAKIDMIASTGDGHKALSILAFGQMRSEFIEDVAAKLPSRVLQHDFIALEKISPKKLTGFADDIARLHIPKKFLTDPAFLEKFLNTLKKDVGENKESLKNGTLSPEEYMTQRQDMLEQSARKAMEKSSQPTNEDLERLKRQAAIEAIRRQMMAWRQSVAHDKRLTPDAKQRAIIRINRLEKRLLVQESVKWEGLSVMKVLALSVMYMQEMSQVAERSGNEL